MEILLSYIPADCVFLVLGLVVMGELLKKYTVLANKYLTLVLPILGAIFMGLNYIDNTDIFLASDLIKQLILGVICGLSSTGGYEWFKNTFKVIETQDKIISFVDKDSNQNGNSFIEPGPGFEGGFVEPEPGFEGGFEEPAEGFEGKIEEPEGFENKQ